MSFTQKTARFIAAIVTKRLFWYSAAGVLVLIICSVAALNVYVAEQRELAVMIAESKPVRGPDPVETQISTAPDPTPTPPVTSSQISTETSVEYRDLLDELLMYRTQRLEAEIAALRWQNALVLGVVMLALLYWGARRRNYFR